METWVSCALFSLGVLCIHGEMFHGEGRMVVACVLPVELTTVYRCLVLNFGLRFADKSCDVHWWRVLVPYLPLSHAATESRSVCVRVVWKSESPWLGVIYLMPANCSNSPYNCHLYTIHVPWELIFVFRRLLRLTLLMMTLVPIVGLSFYFFHICLRNLCTNNIATAAWRSLMRGTLKQSFHLQVENPILPFNHVFHRTLWAEGV